MKRNLQLAVIAITAALSSAKATDATLYYNFAEIREPVQISNNRFDWTPAADLGQYLVPGSLELEYPEIFNVNLLPASQSILEAFEGKEVMLKRDNKLVKAIVVKANIGLFQVGNQYVQGNVSDVVFPTLDGVRFAPTYSWNLGGSGGSSILTYLTRGITWSPRYTLAIKGDDAKLTGWADVRNASGLEYKTPKLELVAGQVNLSSEEFNQNAQAYAGAPTTTASRASADVAPSVEAGGESAGLQTFKFNSPVTMPARTTTSLPFINTKAVLERSFEYYSGFNGSPKVVVPLNRVYNIKTDSDLPGGVMTVREDARVVGQTRISDNPKAEKATFNLGADFDLRLTRTLQTLSRTNNSAKYKVNFSIVNTKSRAVTVKINEVLGGQNYALEAVKLPNIKNNEEGITAVNTLKPGEKFEATYTITFKY
jgi:hypothetical protein